MAMKQRLYDLLEGGNRAKFSQRLIDYLLSLLIVCNVLAVALESMPDNEAAPVDLHAGGV